MSNEELERLMSHYAAGDRSEPVVRAVEAELASNPRAKELLDEELLLNEVLQTARLPEVDHAALSAAIAERLNLAIPPAAAGADWWSAIASPMRIAAAVALAGIVGLAIYADRRHADAPPNTNAGPVVVASSQSPPDRSPERDPAPVVRAVAVDVLDPIVIRAFAGEAPPLGLAVGPEEGAYLVADDTRPARVLVLGETPAHSPNRGIGR